MNDILLKRICTLVAMTYAISKEVVWETYLRTNSIDETLRIISNIKE